MLPHPTSRQVPIPSHFSQQTVSPASAQFSVCLRSGREVDDAPAVRAQRHSTKQTAVARCTVRTCGLHVVRLNTVSECYCRARQAANINSWRVAQTTREERTTQACTTSAPYNTLSRLIVHCTARWRRPSSEEPACPDAASDSRPRAAGGRSKPDAVRTETGWWRLRPVPKTRG